MEWWRNEYNELRPHSCLGNLTPKETAASFAVIVCKRISVFWIDWIGGVVIMKIGFMIIVVLILVFSACASSIQERALEQVSIPGADSLYGDLSEKEDCILNFERSNNERSVDRFSELFQDDCEFISMMGKPDFDADILAGQILRKESLQNVLETTRLFFASAQELRFKIERGMWTRLDSLRADPCADCWETTREYSLSASFAVSGQGGESHVMSGQGYMTFVVSPVDGKWKILRHIDQPIDKQQNR